MAPWDLYVLYLVVDIENILGYPNRCPPNYEKELPKFGGDSFSAITHALMFMRHISKFK